jgi:hypothetical protein
MTTPPFPYQIVSIGPACNVKYQIDHYTKRTQETHLFDWQMTDLATVCQILTDAEPTRFFHRDALEIYGNNATRTHIRVTSLPDFRSIHDVVYPYTEAHLAEYLEKQQRRALRLLALIRSTTPVYFVLCGQPGVAAIAEFEAAVRTVNPACQYHVLCIGANTGVLGPRVAELHLERVARVPPSMPSWTTPELCWPRVFACIYRLHQGADLAEAVATVRP